MSLIIPLCSNCGRDCVLGLCRHCGNGYDILAKIKKEKENTENKKEPKRQTFQTPIKTEKA